MKQLTLNEIYQFVLCLVNKGVDLKTIPVYIGNDDELNGIHTAWYVQHILPSDDDLIELINSDYANVKYNGTSVLIS